jgi:hypothetical protein
VHAWRALINGSATAEQQIRCMNWLALACGRSGVPYVAGPDGERDTLVLIGQQRIGVLVGNMATARVLQQAIADDLDRSRPHTPETTTRRTTPRRRNSKDS